MESELCRRFACHSRPDSPVGMFRSTGDDIDIATLDPSARQGTAVVDTDIAELCSPSGSCVTHLAIGPITPARRPMSGFVSLEGVSQQHESRRPKAHEDRQHSALLAAGGRAR
jgi:hypothetical protein